MSKPLDDFLPKVLLEAPTCPEYLALDAIRTVCIDFCARTNIWQYDVPAVSVVAGTHTYPLTPASETVIAGITEVRFAGLADAVPPVTRQWLSDNVAEWKTRQDRYPIAYMVPAVGSIRLIGIPTESVANGLDVAVALKPSQAAVNVDDILYNDYLDDIARGALAKLLAMKSKDWADPVLSEEYQRRYELARGNAEIKTQKGHTRMTQSVRPRALA